MTKNAQHISVTFKLTIRKLRMSFKVKEEMKENHIFFLSFLIDLNSFLI